MIRFTNRSRKITQNLIISYKEKIIKFTNDFFPSQFVKKKKIVNKVIWLWENIVNFVLRLYKKDWKIYQMITWKRKKKKKLQDSLKCGKSGNSHCRQLCVKKISKSVGEKYPEILQLVLETKFDNRSRKYHKILLIKKNSRHTSSKYVFCK